jgi:hypothetical protein
MQLEKLWSPNPVEIVVWSWVFGLGSLDTKVWITQLTENASLPKQLTQSLPLPVL